MKFLKRNFRMKFFNKILVTSIHNILTKLSTNERDNNPNPKSPILTAFRDKNGVVFVAKAGFYIDMCSLAPPLIKTLSENA